jgi:hypothetical protein
MLATCMEREAESWADLALSMEWQVRQETASRGHNPFEIDDEAFEGALAELAEVAPESTARLDDLEAVEVPSLWLL